LFNANPAIFQQYREENKLIFNVMFMYRLVPDQHAYLDFYSSLKQ